MAYTDYLEEKVQKHVFGGEAFTSPSDGSNIYLALFTAGPTDAGGGTEVSGNAYAREEISFTISGTNPTEAANTAAVEFATATGTWGTVTHVGVFDAATDGNLLAYAELDASKLIETGDVFRVPTGDLKITLN